MFALKDRMEKIKKESILSQWAQKALSLLVGTIRGMPLNGTIAGTYIPLIFGP
jgi:hypothetical protein